MSYRILSLKWRPISFDQISGQDHITQTLVNAISSDRLAQAFLFSGPRGVGKTTTARVLASTINSIKDYNKCLDIIELDGASNRGIDEIREIRESVKFSPSMSKYKVYIIDEAHMLTEQAFNALLKTLEEPPEYIVFILATTDPQKMPQTILSRTQRYDFVRIPIEVINERLKYILDEERIKYDGDAIQLISKKADGSMRDALSILDQVIAYSDSLVSVDSIRSAIGLTNEEDIYELLFNIVNKNLQRTSIEFNKIIDSGISPNNFINDFCSFLNDCMLVKINNSSSIYLSEDLKDRISTNISLGYKDILHMLNMALNLSTRLKKIDNPKISLEVLIIKYVSMMKIPENKDLSISPSEDNPLELDKNRIDSNKVEKKEIVENNKVLNPKESHLIESSSEPILEQGNKELDINNKNEEIKGSIPESSEEIISNKVSSKEKNLLSQDDMFRKIKSNWDIILKKLDAINSKLSSFLEETEIQEFHDNILVLKLDEGNDFIKKVLDSDSKTIEDIVNADLGLSIKIRIETAEKNKSEKKDVSNKKSIEEDHPLLDDAIKIFKGKMIS